MTARPATWTGVATVLAAFAVEVDPDGVAVAVGAGDVEVGDAGVVASGVDVLDGGFEAPVVVALRPSR